MAINQNHPFEEINGTRCAVVERNCTPERVSFLTYVLEGNGYTVVTAPDPPPKAVAPPKAAATADADSTNPSPAEPEPLPPPPETFTLGITDLSFNVINAIYGRLLRSPEGRVVTMAYWQQKEAVSNDEVPYFGPV